MRPAQMDDRHGLRASGTGKLRFESGNTLEPGTPMSFDVLTNEIKGLCLNMELNKKKI